MLSRPLILQSLGFARCVSCKINSVSIFVMDARRVVGTSRFMFAKNDENTEFHLFMFEFYLFSSGMTLTRSQSVGHRARLQAFTFLMALTLKITGIMLTLLQSGLMFL